MKKIISIFVSICILATTLMTVSPVSHASADGTDIPVVHVVGQGAALARINENGEKERIYPFNVPEGYIEEQIEIFLPVFAEAFFTQEWDEFCDVLYDCLEPIFSPAALDKNGEPVDGSFVDWDWTIDELSQQKNSDGKYSATSFEFHYDWRLDPLITADTLHQYIEDVMKATGANEVALYGRCLGSNIVAAYMEKYDGEHICEVIHYASAVYGATQCSKIFTGDLYLHSDGIERFAYDIGYYGVEIDDYIMDFLEGFVKLLSETYGLDLASWAVNNVMKDIYLDIIPRVLRVSYGTFPGYWAMVSINDYEKAKETVFYGTQEGEYAGLIEKIENYRNNVQLTFEDAVKEQQSRGIEFSNIVKYGMQSAPVTRNADVLSDGIVEVYEASFGATASLTCETLSTEHIMNAVANGKGKYISPDNQIDASTCLSPDTTWFVKNLFHMDFPSCINGLVSDIVNNDNFTVYSNQEYTQYLVYDDKNNTITPMTTENMLTTVRWNDTIIDAVVKIVNFVVILFKNI